MRYFDKIPAGYKHIQYIYIPQRENASMPCWRSSEPQSMSALDTWCTELKTLAKHAASQLQAGYAVLTHGLRHKWSFLARTMPAIADLLTPLENSISQVSFPPCTDWSPGPWRGRTCHPGAPVSSWWFGNSKPRNPFPAVRHVYVCHQTSSRAASSTGGIHRGSCCSHQGSQGGPTHG